MASGFGTTISLLAQGMVIVTIAAPVIILLVGILMMAGRAALKRVKRTPESPGPGGGPSQEVLISDEGWGKRILRPGSPAPVYTSPVPAAEAQELPSMEEEEPERRRA